MSDKTNAGDGNEATEPATVPTQSKTGGGGGKKAAANTPTEGNVEVGDGGGDGAAANATSNKRKHEGAPEVQDNLKAARKEDDGALTPALSSAAGASDTTSTKTEVDVGGGGGGGGAAAKATTPKSNVNVGATVRCVSTTFPSGARDELAVFTPMLKLRNMIESAGTMTRMSNKLRKRANEERLEALKVDLIQTLAKMDFERLDKINVAVWQRLEEEKKNQGAERAQTVACGDILLRAFEERKRMAGRERHGYHHHHTNNAAHPIHATLALPTPAAPAPAPVDLGLLPKSVQNWFQPAGTERRGGAHAVLSLVQSEEYVQGWKRPTPKPVRYCRDPPMQWPNRTPCPGTLPQLVELASDCRTTCIGIGNAFGTGKTEVALQSAELTVAAERNVTVAYMCFGNGYASESLKTTMKAGRDGSVPYAGLWLMAAILATRVVNVDGDMVVLGNSALFTAIVESYEVNHRGSGERWPLPTYSAFVQSNLIVIADEVQEFPHSQNHDEPGQLNNFVTKYLASGQPRLNLVVGAFIPCYAFPSGHRVADCGFSVVSTKDMANIFSSKFPNVVQTVDGVSIPELFGGCLRPLASWTEDAASLSQNLNDIPQRCFIQYKSLLTERSTPKAIARAAFADIPIAKEFLQTLMDRGVSLGSAFFDMRADACLVSLPPMHVASGRFFTDTFDEVSHNFVTGVLQEFFSPNWAKFEALTGVAPALRLAALSQMGFTNEGNTILEMVRFHSLHGRS